MTDAHARPAPTRLYLVSPTACRPSCRICRIPLTGPQHHTLCRPCWHWQRHAQAVRTFARFMREEARP